MYTIMCCKFGYRTSYVSASTAWRKPCFEQGELRGVCIYGSDNLGGGAGRASVCIRGRYGQFCAHNSNRQWSGAVTYNDLNFVGSVVFRHKTNVSI